MSLIQRINPIFFWSTPRKHILKNYFPNGGECFWENIHPWNKFCYSRKNRGIKLTFLVCLSEYISHFFSLYTKLYIPREWPKRVFSLNKKEYKKSNLFRIIILALRSIPWLYESRDINLYINLTNSSRIPRFYSALQE